MSRVALVFPYFRTRSATEMLFPPLGAASLVSQLQLLGIESRVFDCTFIDMKVLQDSLIEFQPDIVGIYSMVTLSRSAFQIVDIVRTFLPGSLLVTGGPMPTLYPHIYASHFDVVFCGESDLGFPLFCRDFLQKKITREKLDRLSLNTYPGLFIKNQNVQLWNPIVHYDEKTIRAFPIPERCGFNHIAYQSAWQEKDGTKTTSILTTLGCPFHCDFCSRPVFGDDFRKRDINVVINEINGILQLGYNNLWIADDNFTLDSRHLEQFCNRIADLNITWSCLSRTTGLDLGIVRLMKQSGCRKVFLGLESGSQATLDLMNKKASIEDNIKAVNLFHFAGIAVAAFFMVGYPGETKDTIETTFRFATELPLDECSFNVPFPLPGSNLYERVVGLDPSLDWAEENETTFIYKSDFDPHWIRQRILETTQNLKEKNNSFLKI
jgi:anaerobic magnesium-protoporphyrin IX monomethyl ester cyclase